MESQSHDSSLMPVKKGRVNLLQVNQSCTFGELVTKHEIEYPRDHVYLEAYLLRSMVPAEDVHDVILFYQVSNLVGFSDPCKFCKHVLLKDSGEMFTGDGAVSMAKQILDPTSGGLESKPNDDFAKSLEDRKIRVLVCHKYDKKKTAIEEGSLALLQVRYS